jgi:hypothetical protein
LHRLFGLCIVRPVAPPNTRQENTTMMHHIKTFATVAICLAIINRVSFVKALTSEANPVII